MKILSTVEFIIEMFWCSFESQESFTQSCVGILAGGSSCLWYPLPSSFFWILMEDRRQPCTVPFRMASSLSVDDISPTVGFSTWESKGVTIRWPRSCGKWVKGSQAFALEWALIIDCISRNWTEQPLRFCLSNRKYPLVARRPKSHWVPLRNKVISQSF